MFLLHPQFSPSAPILPDSPGFRKHPTLADKIHCVVYVIDACKASLLSQKIVDKFAEIRKKTNRLGRHTYHVLPQVPLTSVAMMFNFCLVYKCLSIAAF